VDIEKIHGIGGRAAPHAGEVVFVAERDVAQPDPGPTMAKVVVAPDPLHKVHELVARRKILRQADGAVESTQ
jgi:hypothetical protein